MISAQCSLFGNRGFSDTTLKVIHIACPSLTPALGHFDRGIRVALSGVQSQSFGGSESFPMQALSESL